MEELAWKQKKRQMLEILYFEQPKVKGNRCNHSFISALVRVEIVVSMSE